MLTVLLTREHNFRFLLLTTLIYRIEFLPAPTQMTIRMDRFITEDNSRIKGMLYFSTNICKTYPRETKIEGKVMI